MTKRTSLLKHPILIAVLILAILLVGIAAGTYAWFTFTTSARVEPLAGAVSGGGVELLIGNDPNGPFDVSCELLLSSSTGELTPVTTSDLTTFYTPAAQNAAGIPTSYRDVTAYTGEYMLTGTVWLYSQGAPCRVFLHSAALAFGRDVQALASMRLGLRFYTESGNYGYIFKLDDIMDTSAAAATQTVAQVGTVFGGTGMYVPDPAVDLIPFCAYGSGADLTAGAYSVCTMGTDEMARVDYCLYLEGCDVNCINAVQSRDIELQLGFAGLE